MYVSGTQRISLNATGLTPGVTYLIEVTTRRGSQPDATASKTVTTLPGLLLGNENADIEQMYLMQ